jgi:3-hydroxy-9,10-secoandrosta-1,3,5(10)-triene-9,17-dione monooxygenase
MTDKAQLHAQLVAAARELIPVLKSRANEANKSGSLPDETIADFQQAGFFKIVQPEKWGGYELDPQAFFDVQMAVAEGCMSSAWVLGVVAIHNWQLALFDEKAAQDVWGDDPTTLISSSYMPVAKIEVVEGGFNFSGRWSFSSGSKHCEWAFLGGMIPPAGPGEAPDMRTFLLPKSDYKIVENWDVMGLKATGSHDIVVENAFVPEYRTHKGIDAFTLNSPGNAVNEGALYKIPFGQIFPRAVSTSSIGALRGALKDYVDATAVRVGVNDGKKAKDNPTAQYAIAEVTQIVDELELVLERDFDRSMAAARGEEEPLTVDERVKMRWNSSLVSERCVAGIGKLMGCAGGSAVFADHVLNRPFLDLNAGRGHVANNPSNYGRNLGAIELGSANTDFFI